MPKLHFLNVDLDMLFKREPKILLRELGRRVAVLYSGPHPTGHLVVLELASSSQAKDPHKPLRKWIRLLGTLSPAAKQEFENALSRVFDLGFDVANAGRFDRIELPKELLVKLAKLGASYAVTLYAAEPDVPAVTIRKRSRS
jgi:plasmid stabilization system protein ParE